MSLASSGENTFLIMKRYIHIGTSFHVIGVWAITIYSYSVVVCIYRHSAVYTLVNDCVGFEINMSIYQAKDTLSLDDM